MKMAMNCVVAMIPHLSQSKHETDHADAKRAGLEQAWLHQLAFAISQLGSARTIKHGLSTFAKLTRWRQMQPCNIAPLRAPPHALELSLCLAELRRSKRSSARAFLDGIAWIIQAWGLEGWPLDSPIVKA